MADVYRLYGAEDRTRQATDFLREALSVLRPGDAAYPHVHRAHSLARRDWHAAHAALALARGKRGPAQEA